MASTPDNTRPTGRTPTRTPRNRAATAEPPSSRPSVHTPLDRTISRDLLSSVRRATSASGGRPRATSNAPPTPHAQLARRALQDRRTAMFTPGKSRRRSQMEQRETPMDVLRNLSRALAPRSKPVSSSSSSTSAATPPDRNERRSRGKSSGVTPIREDQRFDDDDLDDDEDLPRPRLSLPIDQDDDEEELRPPRPSNLEDFDYTVNSIELPRRMDFDQQANRLSRGSVGSFRPSDVFEQTMNDTGRQSDFLPANEEGEAGNLAELERIDADPTRRSTLGGMSDFGLEMPEGLDGQTTFMMSEPGVDVDPASPLGEQPGAGGGEHLSPVDEQVAAGDEGPMPPIEDQAAAQDEAAEDFPEPEPFDDISDREPLEDISERSDEDGIAMDEPTERTADVEVTEPQTSRRPQAKRDARDAVPLRKKRRLISRHGIEYPSLPPAFVKRVAQTALQSSGLSNPRITADTLNALTQASEWYFEQLGDDLGAYAHHAKRKTVEEGDVATLMRRQRQITSTSTMFSLAQKHLPRELLQELRMPPPQTAKQRRGKRLRDDDGGEGEEDE